MTRADLHRDRETPSLRCSLAQINPKSGDLQGNAALVLKAMERAEQEGGDILVTPELCLTGYCLDEKLLRSRPFLEENKRILMEELLPASGALAVIVGFIDFENRRHGPEGDWVRYNAAAVFQRGRLLQVVRKRLLPAYRYFEDKRYFQAGREVEPVEVETPQGRVCVGVLICEDLWDDDYEIKPSRILREKGAGYLFCINASPFAASTPGGRDGKRFRRLHTLRRRVAETGVPVVYVNTVGIGDNGKNVIVFDGLSSVVDGEGRLVATLDSFKTDQRTVEIGPRELPMVDQVFNREGEIFEALVLGMRDYYEKIGAFRGVLQPVSGGIDSALGTALAYDAFGPELLELYNLPSRYNSEQTRGWASQLAENFGLKLHIVPIDNMVDQIRRDFETHLHPVRRPVTLENVQSRVRGLLMMAESNDRDALLLSNGNATEIGLGYATLYGDMAGGLSIIGDLSKPDVYRLARYVNRKWGREMIPRGTIEAAPSAELSSDQTDPFDYAVVGPVLVEFVEFGLGPEKLIERFDRRRLLPPRYPEDLYQRYESQEFGRLVRQLFRRLNRSVYKRLQGAPIIAVSKRAFGFDLRETLINAWEGRPARRASEVETVEL